jgi:hypothetical protein
VGLRAGLDALAKRKYFHTPFRESNPCHPIRNLIVIVTGVVTAQSVRGCGLDDRGSRVRFPAGVGNFSLHHRVQNGSPIQWVPDALSLRVKRPVCEADHSPPSSVEVEE